MAAKLDPRHTHRRTGLPESARRAFEAMPLIDRLRQALYLAEGLTAANAGQMKDDAAAAMACQLAVVLEDIQLDVELELWCVVKHYHGHVPGGAWAPTVWTAHTTKAQAKVYAPAIERHYYETTPAFRRRWETRDQFKVERRTAQIHELVHPRLGVAEYIRGLG